jgi:hypothetical protein
MFLKFRAFVFIFHFVVKNNSGTGCFGSNFRRIIALVVRVVATTGCSRSSAFVMKSVVFLNSIFILEVIHNFVVASLMQRIVDGGYSRSNMHLYKCVVGVV